MLLSFWAIRGTSKSSDVHIFKFIVLIVENIFVFLPLVGGLETRPYPSQSALDQPPVFQRSPSVGRMLGGPQYPGGTNLPHSSLPGSAAIPAYHQPAAAFTNQHHQLHAQPRPYFGMCVHTCCGQQVVP